MSVKKNPRKINAIKVNQWLDEWNKIDFSKEFQSKPKPFFYLASVPAGDLKALTGIYRRRANPGTPRAKDPNVQRGYEEGRSLDIGEYVQFGFPYCKTSESVRRSGDSESLRKPGWLPTAIVVNILEAGERRNKKAIPKSDTIEVEDNDTGSNLVLPSSFSGPGWEPEEVYPLEVIDGQHRLWAFEDLDLSDDFCLPVVAFHGLDRSWQAYLFWSINITPKKINRSLAFDLYPLLRQEDWLEKFSGHSIYPETRCQEIVEALWSNSESPWLEQINMLGEKAKELGNADPMVTQAAWIRSLRASFVKEWRDDDKSGGLFGAVRDSNSVYLSWNRAMQVALLIFAGNSMKLSVRETKSAWAKHLRELKIQPSLFNDDRDPAFYGKCALLATDQGIRGFLQTLNDVLFRAVCDEKVDEWSWDDISSRRPKKGVSAVDDAAVALSLESLSTHSIGEFIRELCMKLAEYDWRTSSTPGLTEPERLKQAVFRGGSGYKELRKQAIKHLASSTGRVGTIAKLLVE